MEKSPDAFRTISEVADWLGTPTHVLRFWESRFAQVKPVKRAGGRRYYRPSDMLLLGGIKKLLHDDGMTIRGVQKMLREEGIKKVSGYSQPLNTEDEGTASETDVIDAVSDQATTVREIETEPKPAEVDWAFESSQSDETAPPSTQAIEQAPEAAMAVDVPQAPPDNIVDIPVAKQESEPEPASVPGIPKISVPPDMSDHEDFPIGRELAETADLLRKAAGFGGKRPKSLVGLGNIHDRLTTLQTRMSTRGRERA